MKNVKIETILQSAKKIFEKYGYQKASMDDIAKEAMIGKGTIYYYFNSKEDIYLAILNKFSNELSSYIEQKLSKAETLEEKLKLYILEPFEHFKSHQELLLSAWTEESPVFLKKINDFKDVNHQKFKERLIKILEEAKDDNSLKNEFKDKIKDIAEVIFRWLTISGDNVKICQNVDWIEQAKQDLEIFTDVIIYGLINKEETA